MNQHPALTAGRAAVITGGASGIGLAAAKRFAAMGMRVAIADIDGKRLDRAAEELESSDVVAVKADVSSSEDVEALKAQVYDAFGEVAVLMNNAGIGDGGGPFENYRRWQQVLATKPLGGDQRRPGVRAGR